MPGIFISYRRSDSISISGRLYDRLEHTYGPNYVFKDVFDIPAGLDFREVLEQALGSCEVLLAIIGPSWASTRDSDGNRRLMKDNDYVRMEVGTALGREDVLVIPVLVSGARMPKIGDLPEDLHALRYRNSMVLREDPDFDADVQRVIDQINYHVGLTVGSISKMRASDLDLGTETGGRNNRLLLVVGAIVVVAILAVAGFFAFGGGGSQPEPSPSTSVAAVAVSNTDTPIPTSTPEIEDTVMPTDTEAPPTETPTPAPTALGGRGAELLVISIPDGEIQREVYVESAGSDEKTRLTDVDVQVRDAVWSSNRQQILLVTDAPSDSDRWGKSDIFVMSADGSNVTELSSGDDSYSSPTWALDGRSVYYIANTVTGVSSVRVVRLDGSSDTRLTSFNGIRYYSDLTLSPDGREIAFVSERDGNPELYIMNVDGSNVRRLSRTLSTEAEPGWSPDGRRIAFSSNRDGAYEIYVMDADGSNIQQVTDTGENKRRPLWSPDGRLLLFNGTVDGEFGNYVINTSGEIQTRLPDDRVTDNIVDWRR